MQLPPLNLPQRWPSPVDDPDIAVDAVTSWSGDDTGNVTFVLESGASVPVRFSIPSPGVLRVQAGPGTTFVPGFLKTHDGLPLRAVPIEGSGLALQGPGVEATIDGDGTISFGHFRSVRPRGLRGGRCATGRTASADDPDAPAGWSLAIGLGPGDRLFGTGESYLGPDLRGRVRRMVNVETHGICGTDASYLTTPFLWSDAGWAALAVTGAPVRADLGAARLDTAVLATLGDDLDVCIWNGIDPSELLAGYHRLTGLPGRVPEWAFGVWSSRCSYFTEAELHEIVDEYEAADCPVSVVHVDSWVTGNIVRELTCNWTIDRPRYPVGWGKRLAERGVRLSLWHNPYVTVDSPIARDLDARGFLLRQTDGSLAVTPDKPTRNILDLTNPGAVAWWEEQVRSVAEAEGNVSFKPDFAEEIPLDVAPHDGRPGWALRNEYSNLYQAATHRALAAVTGDDVVMFCRSGTAGAQAHPVHWVGDSPSSWEGLEASLRACESLSLSGFGLVAHDVGGFYTTVSWTDCAVACDTFDGSGLKPDVDPELFGRWAQWGALSPMCRFHGTARREPWAYPAPWGGAAVAACRLRERLRGYLVRAGDEAATVGTPVLRPTALTHPDTHEARGADLQYLLGPDILVAPILEPGGVRTLWVPPGTWEPLLGLDPLEGPRFVTVTCEAAQFPAWVRAGVDVFAR